MKKAILLFFSAVLLCTTLVAQNNKGRLYGRDLLKYLIERVKAEYHCPEGWTEHFDEESFAARPLEIGICIFYKIESPDKDLFIIFQTIPIASKEDSAKLSKIVKLIHTRNEEAWVPRTRSVADTLNGNSITYYSKDYAKSKFNADHATEFKIAQESAYKGKYDMGRGIILQKNEVGTIELYYYYNKNSKNINKYIKQTAGMIRFKD